MAKNINLPSITLDVSKLEKQEHEKYGTSYILNDNHFVIDGKMYKLSTFKQSEEIVHEGKKVKVFLTKTAFRPVDASVPKDVTKEAKAGVVKVADLKKTPSGDATERMDKLEAMMTQLLTAVAAK